MTQKHRVAFLITSVFTLSFAVWMGALAWQACSWKAITFGIFFTACIAYVLVSGVFLFVATSSDDTRKADL